MRVIIARQRAKSALSVAALAIWILFGPLGAVAQEPPRTAPTAPGKAPAETPPLPPPLEQAPPPGGAAPESSSAITVQVPVNSNMSLVHVGSSDSFAITPEGIPVRGGEGAITVPAGLLRGFEIGCGGANAIPTAQTLSSPTAW